MKKIKNYILCFLTTTIMLFATGCSTTSNTVEAYKAQDTVSLEVKDDLKDDTTSTQEDLKSENKIQIVGQVVEVFGNEITLQVGIMDSEFANKNTERTMNPEGAKNASGGQGQAEGDNPKSGGTMSADGEMPAGGNRPTDGERPEGGTMPSGGERPEGGSMPAEGANGASGQQGMAAMDFSEMIELTEEIESFNIPVGTKVQQFGSEMTFSQITEDMYITITTDENDTVLAVNILG